MDGLSPTGLFMLWQTNPPNYSA